VDAALHLDDWLGRTVEVVIDRPLGTAHPKYPDLLMETNYGYVPGTLAPDGSEVDAYVLGASAALDRCEARVIAIIRRRDDIEDKLVTAVAGTWDAAAIAAATQFQERYYDTYLEM
jgi:inorganic pyrophosphatase